MLEELKIKNFALIKELAVKFTHGLNILTGETGAGKSIIIDALGGILGEKMTTGHIRSGEDKAIIEGYFILEANTMVEKVLDEMGIEVEGRYLYLRRELNSDGKGRSFINGVMLPTSKLREIGALLVDIHGQNEHQAILKVPTHLLILDNFGFQQGLLEKRKELSAIFDTMMELQEILKNLELFSKDREGRIELLQYAVQEITEARLRPGEEEELLRDAKRFSGSEKLFEELKKVYDLLLGSDHGRGILEGLEKSDKILQGTVETDNSLHVYQAQVQEALYQIQDLSQSLRTYIDGIDFSKESLEEIEARLDLISKFKKKYKAATISEILEYHKKAVRELDSINLGEKEIEETREKLKNIIRDFTRKSADVSNLRLEAATLLESRINQELKDLAMENTGFKVNLNRLAEEGSPVIINNTPLKFFRYGIDHAEFYISAGKDEKLLPLRKIASGGEMSRIMLALKKLIIDMVEPQSMIFDEVDAGIGGKVAERIGNKLRELSLKGQIICITHLPQIASKADIHFMVTKNQDSEKRVLTGIKRLTNKERVMEIARMMAGEQITDLTVQHATEMLKQTEETRYSQF
jgi:DNA repair protein RecN (Recombination protein N)